MSYIAQQVFLLLALLLLCLLFKLATSRPQWHWHIFANVSAVGAVVAHQSAGARLASVRPGRSENVALFRDYSRVFGHSGPIGLVLFGPGLWVGVPCTSAYQHRRVLSISAVRAN